MKTNFTSVEELRNAVKACYKSFEDNVDNLLSNTDFNVGSTFVGCDRISVELVIYTAPEKEEIARWNTLTLSIEEDIFETGKEKQFKTNISTTGEFDLEDLDKGSRANYYVQVGKVLGDKELLGNIKYAMLLHATAIRNLREEVKKIQEEA